MIDLRTASGAAARPDASGLAVGAVVLAAGASRRLGRAKQLIELDGMPLIARVVGVVRGAAVSATCVVVGARAREIAPVVDGAEVVHNPLWETGMASSIHCGVAWAEAGGCDALLLCVCDQPHLSVAHLDALIRVHAVDRDVVASRYGDVMGVPAVFPRARFADLAALSGDRGARELLARCAPRVVRWDLGAVDLDTPRDLAALGRAL
jgi:CTP:molybdopterin cytidylyltransferase MocA